ncbi:DUF4249 domain-containing protein [uncultured Alistipes sp.]|jgi:putative lipoprotein|uniref:DUF4249 domain-containing protein n=1 Tax=uncultured Alistipes sp. TaxID=538949 RepID=UPI0025F7B8C3|nr:DUF4249 domain-containing protein [uncultured Alistipes sp.]
MKKIIPFFGLLLLASACDKEIDIGYRSVEKMLVIEGHVTNEKTELLITRTRDMDDPDKGGGVDGAEVVLTGNDGTSETLEYNSDGYYRPSSELAADPGVTYNLSVTLDGKQYTSYSTMQRQATIRSADFKWVKIMSNRMLMYEVQVEDITGEENYYCYFMLRNGKSYRWNVFYDKGNADGVIMLDIRCMDEDTAKDNKREDWEDILYEGDAITFEVRSIDRRTYDYLYSLALSDRTSANPIDNFSGGCLGYFSAHSAVRDEAVFSYEAIE